MTDQDPEEIAVTTFLANIEARKIATTKAQIARDEVRALRRAYECPVFRRTLLERLGIGNFNVRVQREMRLLRAAA